MGMVVEHMTFGLGTIKMKDVGTKGYAGQSAENVGTADAPISKAAYTAIADVDPLWLGKSKTVALDYEKKNDTVHEEIQVGGLKGNFTDRYHLRVYVYEKTDSTGSVTFTLLSKQGAKPAASDDVLTYKLKVDEFNAHCMSGKPIEISLPSTVKNANILQIECGSAPTTGIIKACIEPKAW